MKTILMTGLLLAFTTGNVLADASNGKALHDAQCMKCHDNKVYTRSDRFISSHAALTKQVTRCQLNVGAQWFDEDVADVVQYLDETFYKFK